MSPKLKALLIGTAAGVGLAIVAGLDWLVGPWLPLGSGAGRSALVTLSLTAAMAALAGGLWLYRRESEAARHFLTILTRGAAADVIPEAGSLPAPPAGNSWTPLLNEIRHCVGGAIGRVEQAEQARTVLEVRNRRHEATLRRALAVFAGLGDPLIVVDDFGDVVLANHAAAELLESTVDDLTGTSLAALPKAAGLAHLAGETRRRKGPAASRSIDLSFEDAPGGARDFVVTARRLAADRETPEEVSSCVCIVLRDVTTLKSLMRRNAEFVSSVSHEMKTPLASIKAYVELLADGDAADEAQRDEFLQVIDDQANRLQRLVDNLLNLARIEAGVVEVSKQSRSLNELLEEALRIVQPAAEAKQIDLEASLSPMYLGVLADRDLLLQAALNLLSNAIKYTPAGGKIVLRSRLANDGARFEVQDTGVGLAPEDCQRVFEKFYRVKKDSSMAAGTGLGLPLAKHIVEDVHGGRLDVSSTPGRGSTFSVTLPSAGQMTTTAAAAFI